MPIVTFLRVEKDHIENVWCVSCIARLKPGFEFLIVCKNKNQADTVVLNISNELIKYPTVDSNGYVEITSLYPHLDGLTRVFEPK